MDPRLNLCFLERRIKGKGLQLSEAGAGRSLTRGLNLLRRSGSCRLSRLLRFRELFWSEELLNLVYGQIVLLEAVIQRPVACLILLLNFELCQHCIFEVPSIGGNLNGFYKILRFQVIRQANH